MMAQLSNLTRPVVCTGTGFHRHDAPGLRCQKTEKPHASNALAKDHMPGTIRSMHLEHVFPDVQTDRGSLLHGRLLRWQLTPSPWHTDAVGGVHPITPSGLPAWVPTVRFYLLAPRSPFLP